MKPVSRALLLCLFLLCLSGCYERFDQGGNLVFGYALWVPLLILGAALAFFGLGVAVFLKSDKFYGLVLMLVGPIAVGILVPSIFIARVEVNDEGFFSKHGLWWAPTAHQVRFDELSQVRLHVEEKLGKRGRKSHSYSFDCSLKSGKQERVPISDVVSEALPEIAERFRKHGIPIHVPANMP